jgi:3-deoxy-D-manno-octulosonic-acid transferase
MRKCRMPKFVYSILLYLALPFVPLKLLWRGIKQPDYLKHWGERFGFYNLALNNKDIIWLHCVSVGETRAAEPLVNALKSTYPNYQILITHGTPTGRETSENLFASDVWRVYLPYDLPFAINGFLKHFAPKIGLIMETELWFNLISACNTRDVPLLLLNARLSEKSAKGYRKIGNLAINGVQSLRAIAAQTKEDAARLQTLGAQHLTVVGNLKFDVKPPADTLDKGLQLKKLLGKQPVFLAASTRDGEEALILDAIKGLDLVTIIVPRHPQRFDEVAALFKQRGIDFVLKTSLHNNALETNIHEGSTPCLILGDTMGELFTYYAACDFAFIGGSLLNYGGQNLIEAASMGKPILIGEHTFNFAKATEDAVSCGAAMRIKNSAELRDKIVYLLENESKRLAMEAAALQFSAESTGATARMMALIKLYLNV